MSFERTLLAGVATVLTGLGGIAKLRDGPRALLEKLGWDLPPGVDDIGLAALDLGAVGERLAAWNHLADAEPPPEEGEVAEALAELALAVGDAVLDLSRVQLTAPQDYLDRTGIVDDFLTRVIDFYLIQTLAVISRPTFDIATLTGLVELRREPADPARFQVEHLRHIVHWDRFPTLVSDPSSLLREVYGWGTPAYDSNALVVNLGAVVQHVATGVRRRELGALPLFRLHGGPVPPHPPQTQLFLPILGVDIAGSGEAGLTLFGLPPTTAGGADGGLGLAPYARATAELRVPLTERLSIGLTADGDLGSGIALVLRPGTDAALHTGLNEETTGQGETGATVNIDLTLADANGNELVSLLAEDDVTVTARTLAVTVTVGVDTDGTDGTDAAVKVSLAGGHLAVAATGLPFIDRVLPEGGLAADVDADLSWSSRNGVQLSGHAELHLTRIIGRTIGPLTIDLLDLALGTTGGQLGLTLSIGATLALGPVELVVGGVGVRAAIGAGPGNLGSGDLTVRPTPPTAIGITIDAGVVTGGGFVARDPSGDYVGALELQLGKIGVKAIGVLTTGPGDWSLLLLLYAQIPPVQIGFGFTLEGIGGLVGVQRGVDIPQLVAGMKTGAFDDLLFPADPVGDALRIIARLRTLFPARARSLTIGPMVDVHWGKPKIITARLAILIQLDNALGSGGGPLTLSKVVVVGTLRVAVGPTAEDPDARVLLLIIDVLGFWDLAEKRYGFLARLRDSSVAGIDLTGSLAVWGEYGDHPSFLLAAGGFNPRFRDIPSQLNGVLDRLGGSFSVGRFDFDLTGYFAVTPATIQAGLDLQATAKIGPVGLHGALGFDVLIYRRPRTHFIADFRIVAEVTYHGHSLAGVKVNGTIEGPGRWHVVGKVSFSILWWDISKSFDESWGTPPPLVREQVDVRALLGAELGKSENWSAQLPVGSDALVTLAPRRGDPTPRAHPLGRFVFAQQLIPFGLSLEQFGDATVAGPNHFEVEAVTIGGRPLAEAAPGAAQTPVREQFARAQFLEMSEQDRLTRPAYEAMDAGVEFSSAGFEVSANPVRLDLTYETKYLDLETGETRPEPSAGVSTGALDHDLLTQLGRYGAAGRASQRVTERLDAVRLPLTVSAPLVTAADRQTMDAVELDEPATSSEMIMEQRIRKSGAAGAQVVESFELARV